MAGSTNSEFWITRILVMAAVIAGAVAFLLYGPSELGESAETTNASGEGKANISESVSRFYAEFRQTSRDPIKEQFGEDTLILDDNNDESLDNTIEQVTENSYEPMSNWEGEFKERAFAAQSTLMQEASDHISKEGFNLVWDLNQDFVIRHRYKSTTTLPGMLEEIAGAIDSNFNQPILVYYCTDKRALVITVRESTYLKVNCRETTGNLQSY